jgi:hypothetical protein
MATSPSGSQYRSMPATDCGRLMAPDRARTSVGVAALIPVLLWAPSPHGHGGPWSWIRSWERALVQAVQADPLGGGRSSASLDDGRSVVSDRPYPPYSLLPAPRGGPTGDRVKYLGLEERREAPRAKPPADAGLS